MLNEKNINNNESRLDVLYIFRPPVFESNSIETVFETVVSEVGKILNVSGYSLQKQYSFLKNLQLIKKTKSSIYHITGDVAYASLFLPGRKVILTIHDLGHYKNLKGIKKWLYGMIWFQIPLWLCSKITVVSDYTKQDLHRFFKLRENKVHKIFNPVPNHFSFSPETFNNLQPVILHIGTAPHKNLENLIKALHGIHCKLHIIGTLNNEQKELLTRNDIQYLNDVKLSGKDLNESYRNADIVSFISRHEGFGMPVIEAQAAGRPVVTSRVCSLPEVAADGACYVEDPEDIDEIKEKIQFLIRDDRYRENLIRKGLENVKRFSAKKIAKEYIELYKSLS